MSTNHTVISGDPLQALRSVAPGSIDLILTTFTERDLPQLAAFWPLFRSVCNGCVVLAAESPAASLAIAAHRADFKHSWIWQMPVKHAPRQLVEPVVSHLEVAVFCVGTYRFNKPRYPHSVLPSMPGEALCNRMIEAYAPEGGTILDPFFNASRPHVATSAAWLDCAFVGIAAC